MNEFPIAGRLYRHRKTGGVYLCFGVSTNSETGAKNVIYQNTDGARPMFDRPLRTEDKISPEHDAWMEPNAEGLTRFERVS